nr:gfo/Idh/MocA family oxidoreductase [Gemmatimonadota bacterium]
SQLDADGLREQLAGYRYGETSIPPLARRRPLTVALQHFAECARDGREPITGSRSILSVMRALDVISRSR